MLLATLSEVQHTFHVTGTDDGSIQSHMRAGFVVQLASSPHECRMHLQYNAFVSEVYILLGFLHTPSVPPI